MPIDPHIAHNLGTQEGVVAAIKDLQRQMASANAQRTAIAPGSLGSNHIGAGQIIAGHIRAGSIKTEHVEAGAIKTDQLDSYSITTIKLNARSVTAEKLEAILTLSSTVQTGVAGQRFVMNTDGLYGYNDSNGEVFGFDLATGALKIAGVLTTQNGSQISTEHLAGTIKAGQVGFQFGGGNGVYNSNGEAGIGAGFGWQVVSSSANAVVADTEIYGSSAIQWTASAAASYVSNYTSWTGPPARTSIQNLTPVQEGEVVTGTAYVQPEAAVGKTMRIRLMFYNEAGTNISAGAQGEYGVTTATPPGVYTRIRRTITVPAGATRVRILVYTVNAVSGDVFRTKAIQVEKGDLPTAYAPRPDEILPGSITGPALAAGAVTTEKMTANTINGNVIAANSLVAEKIASGQLSSAVITLTSGGYLETAPSHTPSGRGVFNNAGITFYNSSNVPTAQIAAGSSTFTGATFQTAALGSHPRLAMDSTGIKATNVSGVETVNISGSSSMFTGATFRTGDSGTRLQLDSQGVRSYVSSALVAQMTAAGGLSLTADSTAAYSPITWGRTDPSGDKAASIRGYYSLAGSHGMSYLSLRSDALAGAATASAVSSLQASPRSPGVGGAFLNCRHDERNAAPNDRYVEARVEPNAGAYSAVLLNSQGNSSFPGILYAAEFSAPQATIGVLYPTEVRFPNSAGYSTVFNESSSSEYGVDLSGAHLQSGQVALILKDSLGGTAGWLYGHTGGGTGSISLLEPGGNFRLRCEAAYNTAYGDGWQGQAMSVNAFTGDQYVSFGFKKAHTLIWSNYVGMSTGGSILYWANAAGADRMYLTQAGQLWTTASGNVSDARDKRDIRRVTDSRQIVRSLAAHRFRWRDAEVDAEQGLSVGLIAQEVETVLPEAVSRGVVGRAGAERLAVNPLAVVSVVADAVGQHEDEIVTLRREMDTLVKQGSPAVLGALKRMDTRLTSLEQRIVALETPGRGRDK